MQRQDRDVRPAAGTSAANGAGGRAAAGELLYRRVAADLCRGIREGVYPRGSRLPGLRDLAARFSVSLSTVIAAVRLLEDEGWVEGRERSGFFVLGDLPAAACRAEAAAPDTAPATITTQGLTMGLLRASAALPFGRLGVAMPDAGFLPVQPLQRAFRQAARWREGRPVEYAFPPGLEVLRVQVARHLARSGFTPAPDDVVVTVGAQEAINLSLRVLTRPGDVVAVESPTYYGLLQAIEALGLKVVEIPTHPQEGPSVAALRVALERWPVQACVLIPNHSNPLGYAMPDERKRALAALLDETGVPLVEDDVYGELGFQVGRPRTVRSYMTTDNAFLVGSASKTISAGLRLGWLVPPRRHKSRVEYLQFTYDAGAATLDQYALAAYLARGGLNRHLRRVRGEYAELTRRMGDLVVDRFPQGTAVTRPAGGYVLWVTGPPTLDSEALYRRAVQEGISIAPGTLFSATGTFKNCFRLNAAVTWSRSLEDALATLAELAHELLADG